MIDQAHRLRALMGKASAVQSRPERGLSEKTGTAIAVTSGKGGVGKSNVALMLSIALSRLNKRVLLMDADLGLANVHILLGMAPRHNIGRLLDNEGSVDDIICKGPEGVSILPGVSGLESMANLDSLQLELLIRRLSVLERGYDFMIIDTGAGIGRAVTEFCRHADMGILVLAPEPTSLADAYAAVKVLYEKKIPKISVIVNMATSDTEGREIFDKLNALVLKFLKEPLELMAILPFDSELPRLIKRQKVLSIEFPHRKLPLRLHATARRICGVQTTAYTGGFFSRLLGHGKKVTERI